MNRARVLEDGDIKLMEHIASLKKKRLSLRAIAKELNKSHECVRKYCKLAIDYGRLTNREYRAETITQLNSHELSGRYKNYFLDMVDEIEDFNRQTHDSLKRLYGFRSSISAERKCFNYLVESGRLSREDADAMRYTLSRFKTSRLSLSKLLEFSQEVADGKKTYKELTAEYNLASPCVKNPSNAAKVYIALAVAVGALSWCKNNRH